MVDILENSRVEFKIKLVDDLEETIIGFLNSKDWTEPQKLDSLLIVSN